MKVLLDENLPRQLRSSLAGHECFTVSFMGWQGIENGELLSIAAQRGFEAMLSGDKGLEYEQNQAALPIPVIVLLCKDNKLRTVLGMVPAILHELNHLAGRRLVKIFAQD